MKDIRDDLAACRLCAERFAVTATQHRPRPIVWFKPGARLLIASQAPGKRVYEAGKPFWDMSGSRLRDWLGLDEATFYDRNRVAIVPMGFCFPCYDARISQCDRGRRGVARSSAGGLCLASSVVAQYRMVEQESLVRGRGLAPSARRRVRGDE